MGKLVQVIIPMSGISKRFTDYGWSIPKFLIEIEGKPVVEHVRNLFPSVERFLFICNEDHLSEPSLDLESQLRKLANDVEVVSISPHKLGPVHAVLECEEWVSQDEEVVVNYVDFFCLWNSEAFLQDARDRNLDASLSTYKGFHPHSDGGTNYAYVQVNDDGFVTQIQEKQPFTSDKTREPTSTGTYYFKSGKQMIDSMRHAVTKNRSTNGEFYVSLAIDQAARDGAKVGVFEIPHFMQWGTPQDLGEYLYWSGVFRTLTTNQSLESSLPLDSSLGVLAGGLGKRFSDAGYSYEKANLPLNGLSLTEWACSMANNPSLAGVTYRNGILDFKTLSRLSGFLTLELKVATLGQAETASILARELAKRTSEKPVTFVPVDNLYLFDPKTDRPDLPESDWLLVWVQEGSPVAKSKPEQFSWLDVEDGKTQLCQKKRPLTNSARTLSGAFSFSSYELFNSLWSELKQKNLRINGEFYLDTLVELALERETVAVIPFEPAWGISLGTPKEYESFLYWQEAFSLWSGHPFSKGTNPLNSQRIRHTDKFLK